MTRIGRIGVIRGPYYPPNPLPRISMGNWKTPRTASASSRISTSHGNAARHRALGVVELADQITSPTAIAPMATMTDWSNWMAGTPGTNQAAIVQFGVPNSGTPTVAR